MLRYRELRDASAPNQKRRCLPITALRGNSCVSSAPAQRASPNTLRRGAPRGPERCVFVEGGARRPVLRGRACDAHAAVARLLPPVQLRHVLHPRVVEPGRHAERHVPMQRLGRRGTRSLGRARQAAALAEARAQVLHAAAAQVVVVRVRDDHEVRLRSARQAGSNEAARLIRAMPLRSHGGRGAPWGSAGRTRPAPEAPRAAGARAASALGRGAGAREPIVAPRDAPSAPRSSAVSTASEAPGLSEKSRPPSAPARGRGRAK